MGLVCARHLPRLASKSLPCELSLGAGFGCNRQQSQSYECVQKVFYEKRNMDLMAANKRATQKRSRVRRETIAHFGPPVDDAEEVGSPCSGATRDSEMSVDAGLSADADPTVTNGTGPMLLPAIGEDQEVAEGVEENEEDTVRKKKHSRGGASPAHEYLCQALDRALCVCVWVVPA